MVINIKVNIKFLPLKFILAKGYAAKEEKIRLRITVKAATIKLLRKYKRNGIWCQTPIKLSKVKFLGIK